MAAKRRKIRPIAIATAVAVAGLLSYAALVLLSNPPASRDVAFGVTFSKKHASSLGLDWKEAYLALLDDLGVRLIRLPVYWDEVEPEPGRYRWEDLDWMLKEAEDRGAKVILVVGRKVPRWPECHEPAWTGPLEEREIETALLRLIEEEVRRYAGSPAVRRWQVENEPLFRFGECPPPDRGLLEREVELVRSLDGRPIMLTDSGELSTWIPTAALADALGISMYRMVWNKHLGFLFWPVTPAYYSERIRFIRHFTDEVLISELQAEPWFPKPVEETPLEEQYASMDPDRLRGNVDFARRTGAGEVYLWGAEWWYWLKRRGETAFWEAVRPLFRGTL
jgi:hypothetical protein